MNEKKRMAGKSRKKYILVTGGAGYIGSHMVRLLKDRGLPPLVFDNLSTGIRRWVPVDVPFVKGDLLNSTDINKVFKKYTIDAVIHFAAKIVVPESVAKPIIYYHNNVGGTLNLLQAMVTAGTKKIIFSSTAAVYGEPKTLPVKETSLADPLNPYSHSKLMVERILEDATKSHKLSWIALRYFNVAGQEDLLVRKTDKRPEATHLIANVIKAAREGSPLIVFGDNYNTPDGSGIRDFIHVTDLCQAHYLALNALNCGIKNEVFNLGSGKGFSVKEVIRAAETVSGKQIPYKIGPRRPAEIVRMVASFSKAKKMLSWKPEFDLETILKSEWDQALR